MKKENPGLKYGLIGAVILVAIGVIMQFIVLSTLKKASADPGNFSLTTTMLFGFFSLVIIGGTMVFCITKAMKEYRKSNPDYTYRKLALQGLATTLIMVLISSAVSYVYNIYIMPEAREQTLEYTRIIYENLNLPEDQKQQMLDKLENTSPGRQVVTSMGLMLVVGMIITLVSAMILNRRNAMYNSNQMR
jgi:preprotein translocase subunit YajC